MNFINNHQFICPINDRDSILEEIVLLDKNSIGYPWTEAQWGEVLNNKHYGLVVSLESEHLVSFSLYYLVFEEELAHLLKIATNKDKRGTGVSTSHFNYSVKQLRELGFSKIYLEVEATNHAAIRFYEKNYFHQLHMKKRYYSDGHDALTMERILE